LRGQDSTPDAVMRCTALSSPPIAPPSAETSFATIQSQPLRFSFALACSITFSVSAAKPTTSFGRFASSLATVARMSGFLGQRQFRRSACVLLQLLLARRGDAPVRDRGGEHADVGRQRGLDARSMSRAVSTRTVLTPGGSGSVTGPLTSVTSAPAAAAARAIA
jgi:hypothetical protein